MTAGACVHDSTLSCVHAGVLIEEQQLFWIWIYGMHACMHTCICAHACMRACMYLFSQVLWSQGAIAVELAEAALMDAGGQGQPMITIMFVNMLFKMSIQR